MAEYIEPTGATIPKQYADELDFLNYLIDKDEKLSVEEDAILESTALTKLYAPYKAQFIEAKAKRTALIDEQKVIMARIKVEKDHYDWRILKYAELGFNQELVDLIEALPTFELKDNCVMDHETGVGFRNMSVDVKNWIEEQKALNQYVNSPDKSQYLQLQFQVQEQREARNQQALRVKYYTDIYTGEKRAQEEKWKKLGLTGRDLRNQKISEHFTSLINKNHSYYAEAGKVAKATDWIIGKGDKDPNQAIYFVDITFRSKPSFREIFRKKSTSIEYWSVYYALSFDDFRKALREQMSSKGHFNYWYPYGKLSYTPDESLRGGIIPKVNGDYKFFIDDMLATCYPFASDVEKNGKEFYPKLLDYGENAPWPSPEQLLWGVRYFTGWGTPEYAKHMIAGITAAYTINSNVNQREHIYLNPHDNINIETWWSERPIEYSIFVPHIGWINPYYIENLNEELYPPAPDELQSQLEPIKYMYSGSLARDGSFIFIDTNYALAKRREAREAKQRQWDQFIDIISDVGKGDIFQQMNAATRFSSYLMTGDPDKINLSSGIHVGGVMLGMLLKEINPVDIVNRNLKNDPMFGHAFRELDKLTGGLLTSIQNVTNIPADALKGEPITPARLAEAFEMALKVGAIVFSGGSAVAIIGVTCNQLKKGTLGETELGRTLLSIGEAVAIAQAADIGIQAAVEKVAEGQIKGLAVGEAVKAAGKDNAIFAAIAATALTEGGAAMLKGGEFMEAATKGATAATKAQVTSKVPGGDILWGAGTQLKDTGSISLSNPLDAFKNIKMGDVKSQGVTGTATNTTMNFLRTQLVKPESIKAPELTAEQKAAAAKKAETDYYNAKSSVIDKLARGEIPTSAELKLLHPEADAFLNQIKKYLPESQLCEGLKVGLNLGLPSFNLPSLDLPGISIPGINSVDTPVTSDLMEGVKWRIPNLADLGIKAPELNLNLSTPTLELPPLSGPDLSALIAALMPRGVALESPLTNEVRIIDVNGKVKFSSFRSPYEHSMLSFGVIPRKLNRAQQEQRLLEIQLAELELQEIAKVEEYNKLQLAQI